MVPPVVALAQQLELLGSEAEPRPPVAMDVTWVAVSVIAPDVRCAGVVQGRPGPLAPLVHAAAVAALAEVCRLVRAGAPPLSWRVTLYDAGRPWAVRLVRVLVIGRELRGSIWGSPDA